MLTAFFRKRSAGSRCGWGWIVTTEPKRADLFDVIVLAAGSGKRFGGGKLSSPWGDGRLLDAALGPAFAAPARQVIVSWGGDARVPEIATAFARRVGAADRLRLTHVEQHAAGMAESLKAAIGSLPPDSAGAFVFLGDMPRVPLGLADRLADAVDAGAPAAAPTFAGQRGHPVLFGAALLPQLNALSGDRGAATMLRDLGDALALVPAPDDGVLFDVDLRS
jgi:molybdenum cofactor cytidylyltransferase